MYRAVTRQIEVTVQPNYMPERSSADKSEYFWSYTIVITNTGEKPVLGPGERFEYTSGVPLPTASGFMTGRYQMVTEAGERFEVDIPTFSLDSPHYKRVLN